MTRTSPKRKNQAAAGAAILCLLLGVGNMIFAQRALERHGTLLQKAKVELEQRETQQKGKSLSALKQPGRFLPDLNLDKQARYISRVQKRIQFYEFVLFGGKILLGASGVLALVALLFLRKELFEGFWGSNARKSS